MKIDIDELEQKARDAFEEAPFPWKAQPWTPTNACVRTGTWGSHRSVSQASDNAFADHIVAAQPTVTLALIARIRELESFITDTLSDERYLDDAPAILEKGAVLL